MHAQTRLRTFVMVAGVSLAAAQLGLGCGTSASAVCDEICDCVGCSENEHENCIDDFEDAERVAENEGCDDQYEEYLSCFDEEIQCRSSELDVDGCESEAESLSKCLGGNVSIGGPLDPCQQLVNKFRGCGFEVADGDDDECTRDAQELASCLNGKSCEQLQDGTAFPDCAGQGDPPDDSTGG